MRNASAVDRPTLGLAVVLLGAGAIHLIRPAVYTPIIPTPLRRFDEELVLASGVAEIACGAGLLVPATRRPAGWATTALLVAVLPANVQMSIDQGRRAKRKGTGRAWGTFAGTILRLPGQWPLIRTALRAAGRG